MIQQNERRPINYRKLARTTTLYIMVSGVALIILIPLFFLISLSFLSNREAYRYPLPLLPELSTKFEAKPSEKGYLISVYDKQDGEYQSVLDTKDLEKMSNYMRVQLSTNMRPEEIEAELARLETEDVIYFSRGRNIWHNYEVFFRVTRDAVPALWRSIQIAALSIIISLSIGGAAGYAFARYVFRGRNALKFSVLFVRMFPAVAIAMPMVLILASINLYDRPLGLALVYSIGSIGLTVWITASIFMGIPVSLEEAALVFGATKFQAFMRITFPLALPGLAAAAMYAFLGAWNETIMALLLTQFNPTFPVVVYQSLIGATGQVNLVAAGGMAMALPALIFTFFIRKYINQMWGGITV